MAIFRAKDVKRKRMKAETRMSIWLTNLIAILRNDSKDCKITVIVVFRIKVNTSNFLIRLPKKKIDKAITATKKVFKEKSFSFTNMQLLVGFLSFYSYMVNLVQVFIWRL